MKLIFYFCTKGLLKESINIHKKLWKSYSLEYDSICKEEI